MDDQAHFATAPLERSVPTGARGVSFRLAELGKTASIRRHMSDGGVLILFNRPDPETAAAGGWQESDAGILNEVRAVGDALRSLETPVREAGILTLAELPEVLESADEAVVFNLVERLNGCECDFNHVPALCRAFGRSCTGNDTDALMLTYDKWLSKCRLRAAGLTVPDGTLWQPGTSVPCLPAPPMIVKPVRADGSEGISSSESILSDADPSRVRLAAERVHTQFRQAALVERFVDGRELNVSVMDRAGALCILPVSEIDFSLYPAELPHIVDYRIKWHPGTLGGIVSPRRMPAPLDCETQRCVEDATRAAWNAVGCRDYARMDFRLDEEGRLFILEVNANPDLSPLAGFPAALTAAGIPFADFVAAMVGNARDRL